MAIRTLSGHSVRMAIRFPDGYTFLNLCISVKTSLIYTKLGHFVNLGVLRLIMWINSCLSLNLRTRTKSFSV